MNILSLVELENEIHNVPSFNDSAHKDNEPLPGISDAAVNETSLRASTSNETQNEFNDESPDVIG